jgi:hypothetical protein
MEVQAMPTLPSRGDRGKLPVDRLESLLQRTGKRHRHRPGDKPTVPVHIMRDGKPPIILRPETRVMLDALARRWRTNWQSALMRILREELAKAEKRK